MRISRSLPHPAYDLIALVFLHLSRPLREDFHRRMVKLLQPGGMLIMEAFTPGQLAYTSGGPKDPHMLYTPDDMAKDFEGLRIIENHEMVIELNEGSFHQGTANVMRLRGMK